MQSSLALRPASQDQTYAITGIKAGINPDSNAVPLRVEVDSWYPPKTPTHVRQVNLFLLSLRFFQNMNPTEQLSYFQVAGKFSNPHEPPVVLTGPIRHSRIAFCALG
jgi:tyrosinase